MDTPESYSLLDFEDVVTRLLNAHAVRDDRLEIKIDKIFEDVHAMSSDIEVIRNSAAHRTRTIERIETDFKHYRREHAAELKESFSEVNASLKALGDKVDAEIKARGDQAVADADMKARFEQLYKIAMGVVTALSVMFAAALWAVVTGKV